MYSRCAGFGLFALGMFAHPWNELVLFGYFLKNRKRLISYNAPSFSFTGSNFHRIIVKHILVSCFLVQSYKFSEMLSLKVNLLLCVLAV